jgi:lipid-binding SYLF domain-containing protein
MSREKCIPPALLREAQGVIVAPDMIKGGVILAARHGHGLLFIRDKDGGWANPVFVTMTGGSIGFQVGIQATDSFLLIKNRRSLDRIMQDKGKLTLGADVSIAAGPLGREASAATDAQMKAEILSYSHSRGVFAGLAFEGDTLRIDWPANEHFYGKHGLTVADIVGGKTITPEAAATARAKLTALPDKTIEVKPVRVFPPLFPER